MHIAWLVLTIVLGVYGLWEDRLIDLEAWQPLFYPLLGLLVFVGGLKLSLERYR